MITGKCFQYIGKVGKTDTGDRNYHLLIYHSLDVAAVANEHLKQRPDLTSFYTRLFGFKSSEEFIGFLLFFIALHDLGKFSPTFQNILPKIWEIFPSFKPNEKIGKYRHRHDTLGYQYWNKVLRKSFKKNLNLKKIAELVGVVTGHHGKPPERLDNFSIKSFFHEQDRDSIDQWIGFLSAKFLSRVDYRTVIESSSFVSNCESFSWWLAGITVLADWLGSNASYFEYTTEVKDLDDYWHNTQQAAKRAVFESGLCHAKPSKKIPFNGFFDFTPTPLQQAVSEMVLVSGPQLFILEDVTGSGKTEAAIYLAHRLISSNHAEGLFFALPTKATADAIYRRAGVYYHKFYDNDERPSFILSHGSRNLNTDFCKSMLAIASRKEVDIEQGSESASTYCNTWLADNQKKALLAEVGIGTIDQALIGVLPQKHQSLRLLGLFNKILVVDEVHSYDPYMNELLCKLIRFQASVGSTVILMSATIPQALKQRFADAFREGAGKEEISLASKAFPLLTWVHREQEKPIEITIDTRKEVKRTVKVELIHEESHVYQLIIEKLKEGCCICWVRNTVDDVQKAFVELQESIPDLANSEHPVFHSRFCLGDRYDIESHIDASFGKDGNKNTRSGRLLIASQVVEQSLDVDFDVLISDLAPIDAVIQRAGRLQRHVRDESGQVRSNKDIIDKREPILYIFGPDPIDGPPHDWYLAFFPKAQYVYRNDNQLWKTAKKLKSLKNLQMPENARELIEYVYDSSLCDIQPNLTERTLEEEGSRMAEQNMAEHFGLHQQKGYLNTENWDETNVLTRLGLDTTNVYLAKWENDLLRPWYEVDKWEYSQIRVSGTMLPKAFEVEDSRLKEAIEEITEAFKEKHPLILPLVKKEGNWTTSVMARNERISFTYDPKFGFRKSNFGS